MSRYTVALEGQWRWRWLARARREKFNTYGRPWSGSETATLGVVAEFLEAATPIFVKAEVAALLEGALPRLSDAPVAASDPPCACGFAFLDGLTVDLILSPDDDEVRRRLVAFAWLMDRDRWYLAEFSEATLRTGQEDTDMSVAVLRVGERIDEFTADKDVPEAYDYGRIRIGQVARRAVSLWAFVQQRLCVRRQDPVDRPLRRRLEREGWTHTPLIEVVELRARDYKGHADDGYYHETTAPDWSCRWIVRRHWVNQWYPSENWHKRILVEAYQKGPPGKPLKTASKLFAVIR